VALERGVHVARRKTARCEPVGVDPYAHRQRPAALDGHALHARQRRQLRLQRAREPIGQRWHVTLRRGETQIEGAIGTVGAVQLHSRRLGLARQFGADLLQASRDFGERSSAVVIEFQAHGHSADASTAGRLDIVDPADRGNRAFDRRSEKAAYRLSARTRVDRRDDHRRALDARELLHGQRGERTHADQHDHEVHHGGEHRVPDEDVGERLHSATGAPAPLLAATDSGFGTIETSTASRSLNEPDVATCSPATRPSRITTSSPASASTWTGRCCARGLLSLSCATTNTKSPPGPLRNALAGMATARRETPAGTCTRTDAPGDGASFALATCARTAALRVDGSTRESVAMIVARMGALPPVIT